MQFRGKMLATLTPYRHDKGSILIDIQTLFN